MTEVRYVRPDEQEALVAYAKSKDHPIPKEFAGMWTRWDNWGKHPPLVIVDNGIIGFHAFTYTKSGYVNSYYQYIDAECRGQGLAGKTLDIIFGKRPVHVNRLKIRCKVGGGGDVFWQGFGLKPIGFAKGEHFYDLSLEGVQSAAELAEKAAGLCNDVTTDKRSINHYRKMGVELINDAWEQVLPMTPLRLVREMAYENGMTDDGAYWHAFVNKPVPEQVDELHKNFSEYDFDKLLLESRLLSPEEVLDLVGGDESGQVAVVKRHGVHYLDEFLEAVFNWSG